jgi:hypothetical protein
MICKENSTVSTALSIYDFLGRIFATILLQKQAETVHVEKTYNLTPLNKQLIDNVL